MKKIKAVYDHPDYADRYTVFFGTKSPNNGMFNSLHLDDNPERPSGISNFGMGKPGRCNGKKIKFESLPKNVQQHVMERLKDRL